MSENAAEHMRETLDTVYRSESRRILATLIRLLGDFNLAEEALHDAFRAALEQWPRDGLPANPRAWLVSTGRFKAIDTLRRRARFDASLVTLAEQIDRDTSAVSIRASWCASRGLAASWPHSALAIALASPAQAISFAELVTRSPARHAA